jgi:hypothetical protein
MLLVKFKRINLVEEKEEKERDFLRSENDR